MKKQLAVLSISLLASLGSASAGTFLQVFQSNSGVGIFNLINDGTSNTLSVTNGSIFYDFSVPNTLGTGIRTGLLNFTATTTGIATGPDGSGNDTEAGWSGSGSIFDSATSTLAFSWTFGPTGALTVSLNGTSGTFTDSRPPAGEVNMSSPYLDFTNTLQESFGIAMSGSNPAWSVGTAGRFAPEVSSGVLTFDANPLPVGTPEPATMALMGSALIGLSLLARKRVNR